VAFQEFGRQLDFSAVESVVRNKIEPAAPDITFWMDLAPRLARERIRARHKESGSGGAPEDAEAARLENEAETFHKRVQNGYEILYGKYPQRIVRIDATAGIGEVAEQVWTLLTERFDVP
jgi:dTMP kinase